MMHEQERATYISLTSDFASVYFNLIKADKLIDIQNELIKTRQEILSKTTDKYKAGLCPITELLAHEKILTSLKEEYNLHLQTREVLISSIRAYLSSGILLKK